MKKGASTAQLPPTALLFPIMNWLIKNFLRGLVVIVPIAATIWVLYYAFVSIDNILGDKFLGWRAPGLGVLVLLVAMIVVGALASNFVGRKFVKLTDSVFTRAPLVRIVYAAVKDLLEAFVGDKKRFDRPVAVALSDTVTTLGFVTQNDLSFLAMSDRVAVYLPFSYSVAGVLLVVPASRVTPLDADSASIMALVVSGGVSRV
jgi:uncharacterized membrane protein